MLPAGCMFRDRALAALARAGLGFEVVYVSASLLGVAAAAQAGFALTCSAAAGCRRGSGRCTGLPDLARRRCASSAAPRAAARSWSRWSLHPREPCRGRPALRRRRRRLTRLDQHRHRLRHDEQRRGGPGRGRRRLRAAARGTEEVFRSILLLARRRGLGRVATRPGPAAIEAYLEDPLDSRLLLSMKSYLAQRSFTETRILGQAWGLEALVALFLRELLAPSRTGSAPAPPARVTVGRPVHFVGELADDALGERRLRAAFAAAGLPDVAVGLEPAARATASPWAWTAPPPCWWRISAAAPATSRCCASIPGRRAG
jgi:hypothetical protein